MKPIIGILAEIDADLCTKVRYSYVKAIEKSGGAPILLPYTEDVETIEAFVEACDGFLFTGGGDIDPMRYGESARAACGEIERYRDSLEFAVFQKAINTSKPILAICRGAQLVNVALGGTLYQDVDDEINNHVIHRQTEPEFSYSHEVKIFADTPLYALVREGNMRANSFHHQAIKKLGAGLEIMAIADDGVVEAVYLSGERYVQAYQWHPERLYETDKNNRRIFEDYIDACRHARGERGL